MRQEESRDGQSFEVLKNQNMLHIMSENEKDLLYSLGVNQFTDLTKEEFESTYLGYNPPNMSMLVTTLGRFHYDGGIKDLPSDCDWSESSVNTCEEPGHHVPPPLPCDVGDDGSYLGRSSQGKLRRSVAGKMEISSYAGVRKQVRFAPCTDFRGKN